MLWGGGLVSSLGSWLLVLAIPAHVFLATRSLRATGLALAAVAVMLLGASPGRYWVGMHALRAQPVARALLPVTIIFLAVNASLSAVLIPFGVQRLGGSEHTRAAAVLPGRGLPARRPVIRVLLDRVQPRDLLTASLTASLAAAAAAYFLLFAASSVATAMPAAVAVGMFGSMSLVIPQTAVQRVIPNAVLGRVSAVFLTAQAAATLAGAVAGPFLAQALQLSGVGAAASLGTLSAAALTRVLVPRMPVIVPGTP